MSENKSCHEKEQMTTISVRIPKSLAAKYDEPCKKLGIKRSDVLRVAIYTTISGMKK